MLSQELRKKLKEEIKKDPKKALKMIEKEPQILQILLNSEEKAEETYKEKIKYVNMNSQMQAQLEEKAKQLKITQGILIGGALLWFLSLLDE